MNFGERLKQIRTERNLTQPQMATAIGIEQSYLSKLENEKSIPSAEMFSTILTTLEMSSADFFSGLDSSILRSTLRHIPESGQFLDGIVARRMQEARRWLLGAAATGILGFSLMLAASDGILSSNLHYKYTSKGVISKKEPDNFFDQFKEIQNLRLAANIINTQEHARLIADFEESRVKVTTVELSEDLGSSYVKIEGDGRRKFELTETRRVPSSLNRILQYIGGILVFCSISIIFIEWRIRHTNKKIKAELN